MTLKRCATAHRVAAELSAYLERLREAPRVSADADIAGVARMLMGSLFAGAVSRDIMPERYPGTLDEAADRYAQLALGALGSAPDPGSMTESGESAS